MDDFLFHPHFRVAICTRCNQAVTSKQLEHHVRTQHEADKIHPADERAVRNWIKANPTLLPNQDAARALLAPCFTNPPPTVPFLPGPYDDGKLCARCHLLIRTVDGIQKHFRTKHNWTNTWARGRPVKGSSLVRDVPWVDGIRCQRLFASGPASTYFPVSDTDPTLALTQAPVLRPQHALLDSIKRRVHTLQHPTAGATTIITSAVHDDWNQPHTWVTRTGWARYLDGKDAVRLHASTLLENGTPELETLWGMVEVLVREAEGLARRPDSIAALYELGRKEAGEGKPKTPFAQAWRDGTIESYTTTWKELLTVLVREHDFTDDERHARAPDYAQEDAYDDVMELLRSQPMRPYSPAALYTVAVWCLSLMGTPFEDNPFDSCLLSAMAVLAVRPDGSFSPPNGYTKKIAAILTVTRLFILWAAYYEHSQRPNDGDPNPPGLFRLVRAKVTKYVLCGVHAQTRFPIDWLTEILNYGRAWIQNSAAKGIIEWDGDAVRLGALSFSLPSLRLALHNMVTALEDQVAELLFWDAPYGARPPLDLASLRDDRSIDTAGESFLSHPANAWLGASYETLLARVLASAPRRRVWCVDPDATALPDDEQPFHVDAVQSYEERVETFLRLLLVVTHLSSGQPGRSPETVNVRYVNTVEGGVRNVFLSQGYVVFTTWNTKTSRSLSQSKIIYRFLPRRVSEVLVRYLAHVVPFLNVVREMTAKDGLGWDEESSVFANPYVWGGTSEDNCAVPWSSDRLSRHLKTASAQYLGAPFTVAQWRHLSIAITNRYLRDLAVDDDAASRKRKRGGRSYGNDGEADPGDSDSEDDNVYDLQASHSSRTAGTTYGRLVFQGTMGTAHGQDRHFHAATQWHNLVLLGAPGTSRTNGPWTFNDDDDEDTEQARRLRALADATLQDGLILVAGRGARFRGRQAEVLASVVRGVSPLLWVAGTGSGKSIAFLVPAALAPGGVTIVVVPLLTLQSDLVRRCEAAQIRSAVWTSRHKNPHAPLVFCTPEQSANPAFTAYTRQLVRLQQLDRIVYDECHCILDSDASFRPVIQHAFRAMLELPVQHIWLTATLPPSDEATFFQRVNVSPSLVSIVREGTRRATIAYETQVFRNQTEIDAALRGLVAGARAARQRMIVFCNTVATAEGVAKAFQAPVFHARLGSSVEEKQHIVRQWANNPEGGPIVATSALGLGLDVPDVALVVHYGVPWCFRDFVQESGRAGRTGGAARSVLLVTDRAVKWAETETPLLYDYIQERVCYRTVLARVLDGVYTDTACRVPSSRGPVDGPTDAACSLCLAREVTEPSLSDDDIDAGPAVSPTRALVVQARTHQAEAADRQREQNKQLVRDTAAVLAAVDGMFRTWACPACTLYKTRGKHGAWQSGECWKRMGPYGPNGKTVQTYAVPMVDMLEKRLRATLPKHVVRDYCQSCWLPKDACQVERCRPRWLLWLFCMTVMKKHRGWHTAWMNKHAPPGRAWYENMFKRHDVQAYDALASIQVQKGSLVVIGPLLYCLSYFQEKTEDTDSR